MTTAQTTEATEQKYGRIEPDAPEFPPRAIIITPPSHGSLTVSPFGPSTYVNNLAQMQGKKFSCLPHYAEMSFREPTTSESILAAAYKFAEMAKPQILDPGWLQLGSVVRTSKGVFVNTTTTDVGELQALLGKFQKTSGRIWLYDGEDPSLRDSGFAPYETFKTGVQDSGDFVEGGLARVLEHTRAKAKNLGEISAKEHYKLGVNVCGFDPVSEPVQRVASLYSLRDAGGGRLDVDGDDWDDADGGYVFGVLNSGEASAPKVS